MLVAILTKIKAMKICTHERLATVITVGCFHPQKFIPWKNNQRNIVTTKISTFTVQAIAFSAGLNSIQEDQVNNEDNSRAGISDKWYGEHILSYTKLFAVANITLGYSCYEAITELFIHHPCFFTSAYHDLWNCQ